MKKLLALLLALMLALSCTLALAETTEVADVELAAPTVAVPQAITLASELDIDRDVLKDALTAFNVNEQYIALADTVAAVLTETSEQLVFADMGLAYDLFLKDTSILSLNGEVTEEGVSMATSLLPSYVLTVSSESIMALTQKLSAMAQGYVADGSIDMNALMQSLTVHSQNYINSCVASVSFGESEMGAYEINGVTYNVKTPINVDIPAIMEAATKLTNDLIEDPNVQAAVKAAQEKGFDISLTDDNGNPLEAGSVDPATLPAITMDAYMNVDAEGNVSDTTDVVFEVTLPGSEEPATTGDVLVQGNNVTVSLNFLTAATTAVFTFLPQENGADMRLDVDANGIYAGLSLMEESVAQQSYTCQADVFLLNDEKPLVTEVATLYLEGERAPLDSEGKTVYALDDVINGNAQPSDLTSTLGLDLVLNGITGLLSDATNAMPEEFAPIAQMITGAIFGGSTDTVAE